MAKVFTLEPDRCAYHPHDTETLVKRYELVSELLLLYSQLDWNFTLAAILGLLQNQFQKSEINSSSFDALAAVKYATPARVYMSAQFLTAKQINVDENPKILWIHENDPRTDQLARLVAVLHELSQLCCAELPDRVLNLSPKQIKQ